MRYTPVELRHVTPPRGLRGYKRAEVDRLIQDVADSFEEVWGERGELADRLEDLEKRHDEVKQREALLASTLVAAERTAAEQIETAKREAEVIIAEAHQESRSIMRAAQMERERLFAEARRVETLLRAALGMVEESRHDPSARPAPPAEAGAPASEEAPRDTWPNRENTSEFKAVDPTPLPPVQEQEQQDEAAEPPRDFAWG